MLLTPQLRNRRALQHNCLDSQASVPACQSEQFYTHVEMTKPPLGANPFSEATWEASQ